MTRQQATRARELAALGVGQRGIAAELGLSRRQVERALAETAPAPTSPAPAEPARAEVAAVDALEVPTVPDLETPASPAPRRTATAAPPPLAVSSAPTPSELRKQRYREDLERARLAVEAHGYRGAPPSHAPPVPMGATLDDARRALRNATGGRVI